MIKINDKYGAVYHDHYKPANVYKDGIKIAGYKEVDLNGKNLTIDDTYDDKMDVVFYGEHTQDDRYALCWNQLIGGPIEDIIVGGDHIYSVRYTDERQENRSGDNIKSEYDENPEMLNGIIQITDLTLMFGAGYECSAEQFKKMFPLQMPYCKKEWIYVFPGHWLNFNQLISNTLTQWTRSGIVSRTWDKINTRYFWRLFVKSANLVSNSYNTVVGHKYLVVGEISNGFRERLFVKPNGRDPEGFVIIPARTTKQKQYHFFYTAETTTEQVQLTIENHQASGDTDNGWLGTKYLQSFDLTQMFGCGNEPETLEEFQQVFNLEYYSYVQSRYESTDGFVENGIMIPQDYTTAYKTPFVQFPEPITSPSDDITVRSKSILWNQLMTGPYNPSGTGENGIVTVLKNTQRECQVVCNKTVNTEAWPWRFSKGLGRAISDTSIIYYRFRAKYTCPEGMDQSEVDNTVHIIGSNWASPDKSFHITTEWKWYHTISTVHAWISDIYIKLGGHHSTEGVIFDFADFQVFDLTSIFGEGNEPKTEEEFRYYFSEDWYPKEIDVDKEPNTMALSVSNTTHLPVSLYGKDGLRDMCEPNVLVDGEYKCRVTKHWKRIDFKDLTWSRHNSMVAEQFVFRAPIGDFGLKQDGDHQCTIANKTNGVFANYGMQVTRDVMSPMNDDNVYLYIHVPEFDGVTLEQFVESIKNVYGIFELESPEISLYDPIEFKSTPTSTIIDTMYDTDVHVKVVDNEIGGARRRSNLSFIN